QTLQVPAANDVAAEVWLSAASDLGSFDGDESSFRAWLFTIARRLLADRYPDCIRPSIENRSARNLTPLPEGRVTTQGALSLIGQSPPDQAEVIALHVIAKLDVRHIAAITGKRDRDVRALAECGLRHLRDLVQRSG